MKETQYKFQLYKKLELAKGEIFAQARKASDEIGIPVELKGQFGLTGAISGCPAPMRDDVLKATEDGAKRTIPLRGLMDEIRFLVKEYYGDGYDAVSTPTCEAGLWLSFDVLAAPPMQGRGDAYRTRYLALYEKHLHHHGSYGRPYPAKYKDLFSDRGCTSGELGFYGKRQFNVDAIIARLVGANYEPHGIKYFPAIQLTAVDPEASMVGIRDLAAKNASTLSALTSLGYDTPGYGYGAKDEKGIPRLQVLLGELAKEYDIPYIVDNAWGLPFIGADPREMMADILVYSMDKATGAPTSGMLIGKEELMVPLRRALGVHSDRWGTSSSYGKASYVIFDPGKEALLGQIAVLKALLEKPEIYRQPVDDTLTIVKEEFASLPENLRENILITPTYNSGAVEINYEGTWKEGIGIPIFTIEDMYASSNLLQSGLGEMGIIPTIGYDGNILVSPGQGTTDNMGQLVPEKMRYAIKGLVKMIEIISRFAGIIN